MRPSEALALNRDKILEVLSRYPVRNPKIFGSVARGEDTEDNDLDLLVDKEGGISLFKLSRLERELEALTGVRTEVHTPGEFGERSRKRIAADLKAI